MLVICVPERASGNDLVGLAVVGVVAWLLCEDDAFELFVELTLTDESG